MSADRGSLRRPPRPPRSWARTGPVSIATRVPMVGRACISRGCMNTLGCGCISRGARTRRGVGARTHRGVSDRSREQRHDGVSVHRGVGASPVGAVTPPDTLPRRGVRTSPVGAWHGRGVRASARGCVVRCNAVRSGQCGARCPSLRRARYAGQARGGGSPARAGPAPAQAGVLLGCCPPAEVSQAVLAVSKPVAAPCPAPGTAGQAAGREPAVRSRCLPSAESTVQSLLAWAGAISLTQSPVKFLFCS